MEKRTISYDLNTVKCTFSLAKNLRMTATALKDARSMGFSQQDIVNTIQQIRPTDFVKSMTTHTDHRVWQDVYNTRFGDYHLYIKFQMDEMGHFVISFKEK